LKKTFAILILILILTIGSLYAQKRTIIDSLKNELLKTKEDTNKVLLLNIISRKFYSINPDSTEFYAKKALEKSIEVNYYFGTAKSYRMLGLSYLGRSEYDEALKYLFMSLKELQRTDRISEFATVYTTIGIVYRQKSDYHTALKYYFKVLEIVESKKDSARMSPAYNNIGVVYKNMKDYDKALEFYQKSLNIKQDLKDNVSIPYTLGNIGIIYIEKKEYKKAIEKLSEVLKMFLELGFKNEIANSYLLIGRANFYLKEYDTAFVNVNKSIEIYSETGEKSGLADALLTKGNIYYAIHNFSKAELLLKKAFNISKEIESDELVMNSYKYLSKLDSINGNYKSALTYYHKYIALKEQIFSIEKANEVIRIQAKYDISIKEKENSILRKNKEISDIKLHKQTTMSYFTWVLSGLLIFVVFFIVFFWKREKKNNRILNQKNDEISAQNISLEEHKEKISSQYKELEKYKNHLEKLVNKRTVKLYKALKETKQSDKLKTEFLMNLSHEIRTPINAISGFSEIILNDKKDFKLEYLTSVQRSMDDLVNTIDRLVIFSKLQVGGYEVNPSKIKLTEFFKDLEVKISERREFLNKSKISLDFDINYNTLPKYFYTDEYILINALNELIENAFKFTNEGQITIKASINEGNDLCIGILDTGMGIKKDVIPLVFDFLRKFDKEDKLYRGMGVGLALVKKATEILSGTIKMNSIPYEGAEFIITIPNLKSN